jgi:hypothetical protein
MNKLRRNIGCLFSELHNTHNHGCEQNAVFEARSQSESIRPFTRVENDSHLTDVPDISCLGFYSNL